jgi:acetyltransferase-like isoleucine patch superfamily enzyme
MNVEAADNGRRRARGRDIYRFFKPVLLTAAAVLGVMPRSISKFLWDAVAPFRGRLWLGLRWALARRLAKAVGENVFFGPNLEVRGWEQWSIGNNVSIHNGCFIDASGGLTIASDVSIAHQCSIITFEHTWRDRSRPIRDNPLEYAPITIDSDVWIGCGSRILAGVTIGSRVIVAAGSVVTKAIRPGLIVGGVPAKELGSMMGSDG